MYNLGEKDTKKDNIFCAICKKQAQKEYFPFCSKQCSDVDLGRWLNDYYVIAGTELETMQDREDDQEE